MKKSLIILCCLFLFGQTNAQFECSNNPGYANVLPFCSNTTLSISSQENITTKLKSALQNYCRVTIPNNGLLDVTYYLNPIVFSGNEVDLNTAIQNKDIVLQQGVTIQGVYGGTPNSCSNSLFTFDGAGNQYIRIRGQYTSCDNRPTIRMAPANYGPDATTGYLVASDNVGDPYLNSSNQPNYVFDDGTTDPYFNSLGEPNLIANFPLESKVQKDCDYNFNLCNQPIIVWCPDNWEGNHIIAVHGAKYVTVQGLNIETSAGGDGIVLAGDEDGTPAYSIKIQDVEFNNNARTGINIVSASCLKTLTTVVQETGVQAGINGYVDIKGGVAFQNYPNGVTVDTDYYMENIRLITTTLADNEVTGITVDLISNLSANDPPALDLELNRICISNSPSNILFDNAEADIDGTITMRNINFSGANTGFEVTGNWQNTAATVTGQNWDLTDPTITTDVAVNSSSTFCPTFSGNDICLGSSTGFCGMTFSCNTTNNNVCQGTPDPCPPSSPCTDPVIFLTSDGPLDCDNLIVTISANTSGYCYEWSNGETGSEISVVKAGTYCVTVTDCVTSCSTVECIEVTGETCECLDCHCDLTITTEDIGEISHQEVWFFCDGILIDKYYDPGTFVVSMQDQGCEPLDCGLYVAGNNGTLVRITLSGCGYEEDVIIEVEGGDVVDIPEIDIDCLPCPEGEGCEVTGEGTVGSSGGLTTISWDPVPDAESYIITVTTGNSDCCPENNAPPLTTTYVVTTGTTHTIPNLPDCYTWTVQAVGEDGAITDDCEKHCADCEVLPPDPDPCMLEEVPNPTCKAGEKGPVVTWAPISGAVGYNVYIYYGDPACCPNPVYPGIIVYQTEGTEFTIPPGTSSCYSVQVEALCEASSSSGLSQKLCFNEESECVPPGGGDGDGGLGFNDNSVEGMNGATLMVFPNPAKDVLNIRLDAKVDGHLTINLISADGSLVQTKLVDIQEGFNSTQLETSNLTPGFYFLQLDSGQERFYQKITIIK